LGPDLQGAEVVPVLFEPRLLERKDNPLAVTEVSVALTDDVGEMDEAAARDLWGVNSAPAFLSIEPPNGPTYTVLVLGHSDKGTRSGTRPRTILAAGMETQDCLAAGCSGSLSLWRPTTRKSASASAAVLLGAAE